jgi:serine/threonine-protein kinase RIO1
VASRFTERYAPSEVLPRFDLDELTRFIAEFEVSEVGFEILAGREGIVYRVKRKHCVVYTIKTFTINLEDRIS